MACPAPWPKRHSLVANRAEHMPRSPLLDAGTFLGSILGDGGPAGDHAPPLYLLSYCVDTVLVVLDMNGRPDSALPQVGVLVYVVGTFSGVGSAAPPDLPYNCTAATSLTDALLNITSHIFNVRATRDGCVGGGPGGRGGGRCCEFALRGLCKLTMPAGHVSGQTGAAPVSLPGGVVMSFA